MKKQYRNKKGQYGHKTWRARLNTRQNKVLMFVFCSVVWTVNAIDWHFLPHNKLVIHGSPVRLDTVYIQSNQEAVDSEAEYDGGIVTTQSEALPTENYSASSIEGKIRAAFPEDPDTAVAIAKAESGLNANAKGDMHIQFIRDGKVMGHSCGVFQVRVLPGRPDCETLKNVDENIKFARHLYEKSGFYPWSAWKNKSYLKYL